MGPQRGEALRTELGISTFEDLLYYYPYRYFDRSKVTRIGDINAQTDYAQFAGTLINIAEDGAGNRTKLTATLYDDSGRVELIWFQNAKWIKKSLVEGNKYVVFGKVSVYNGYYNISHPEVEAWNADTNIPGMQPVYSTTEKLKAKGITNRSFAKLTYSLFEKISPGDIPEVLPPALLSQYNLCNRFNAVRWLHYPETDTHEQMARHRLKWEELLVSQLQIGRLRMKHSVQQGWIFNKVGDTFNNFFHHHLPFGLTNAQKRVMREIRQDTATGKQMNRLLQGDVGSGKTIVAVMSMLLALDNGFQACIMAPTEILAQQHFFSISELLEEMGITIKLLTGSVKGKERKAILAALADGSLKMVAGTHALIEESVQFQNLGLAVIDEQHRFGVGQRARLWAKNEHPPHVLVMTATPIPRTLALTMYADLEVSVIDELPPGRREIKTVHRRDITRANVMEFIRKEVDKGRQAYIVYPLIEESEKMDYESLMAGYEQVKVWFNENKYRIAMVHGRQPSDERQRNMVRFVKGQAQVLVATTVIEVGVNVPNASVMLIESAERFGLSQLHQLRGRVGRGGEQSYCILMTGNKVGDDSMKRINIMVSTTNGFTIAEEDLKMRGPGDMYGTRQSGVMEFKLADLTTDLGLLEQTRDAAREILSHDPQLSHPVHAGLRYLLSRVKKESHWGKIS